MKTRIFATVLALFLLFALGACEKPTPEPEFPEQDPATTPVTDPTPSSYMVEGGAIAESTLTWEMHSDGTLYIKGSGDMPDIDNTSLENSDLPWNAYRQGNVDTTLQITRLVVEEGVTGLSEKAFSECSALTEVKLPESLTAIPYSAFLNCRQLTTVSGGLGLVTIEENAFQGCTALRSISLSSHIRTVEFGAFDNCGAFSIYFTGSDAEWLTAKDALSVASGNAAFEAAMEAPRIFPR